MSTFAEEPIATEKQYQFDATQTMTILTFTGEKKEKLHHLCINRHRLIAYSHKGWKHTANKTWTTFQVHLSSIGSKGSLDYLTYTSGIQPVRSTWL